MPPLHLFVPYVVFRHLCNIIGYGGWLTSTKDRMSVEINTTENAEKVFSPLRFQGTNFLKKRHFETVMENVRKIFQYSGRAVVVVGKNTPITFTYQKKQEKFTVLFYVQRYDKEDFCLDATLQALLNQNSI